MTADGVRTPTASTSRTQDDSSSLAFPPLTRAAVDACAFQSWFPLFKRVTPKATIIPLDEGFVDYLRADGLFLPDDDELSNDDDAACDPNGEEHHSADDDSDEEENPITYDFSKLSPRIQSVIDEYGSVFPKLNWSSPQDAAFMCAGPPLKCVNPNEVYLLLKSSDFITHDLEYAYEDCTVDDVTDQSKSTQYHLVLKKWFEMPRSHEFRCFVRSRTLRGITQRDSNFYDFLQDSERKALFTQRISDFYEKHIREKAVLDDYVFDVYLTRDETKVFLIDMNPFAPRTDSLLFDWQELLEEHACQPLLRVIRSETQASQSMPAFSHNRYPQEVVGMSDGASIAEFAQKWRTALEEATATSVSAIDDVQPNFEPTGR